MEDALSLNGDVRTTMIGADWARAPLTVGLSVGRTLGLGGYSGPSGGQMTKSMTGFYPWVGYQVNERVSVWGVTGYGTGSLSLTPDGQSALETGVSMAMSAVGTRGELIGSRATGGFALASFTGPQLPCRPAGARFWWVGRARASRYHCTVACPRTRWPRLSWPGRSSAGVTALVVLSRSGAARVRAPRSGPPGRSRCARRTR